MHQTTTIIIKHKLLKSAKDLFKKESKERNQANRMTYILGARHLLLLLAQQDILGFEETQLLFNELDLNKIKV